MKTIEKHVPLSEERQSYLFELSNLFSELTTVENTLIPSIQMKLASEAALGRSRDTAVAASNLKEAAQTILTTVDSLSGAYREKRQSPRRLPFIPSLQKRCN
ncbi:hypothetical protein N9L47_11815 [Rhodobacteraceae bacterium]|nr:hypothetical protein [Paracoccaceae bacterium]